MKQTDLREQWEARIKDYRASGLTAEKWCAENEVTTRQLWYWLRKFRESKESPVRPPQWECKFFCVNGFLTGRWLRGRLYMEGRA